MWNMCCIRSIFASLTDFNDGVLSFSDGSRSVDGNADDSNNSITPTGMKSKRFSSSSKLVSSDNDVHASRKNA